MKTCPSAIFSTTNSIWIGLVLHSGFHGDRLTINCLSHGTSQKGYIEISKIIPMYVINAYVEIDF